jgi:ABC-type transport system involved in cytochrome bd biosynthesis fused ATPase/permease subunit
MLVSWLKPGETRKYALIIGIIFLIGGIAACFMIPAPGWFMAADLLLAYIPMALLGEYIFNRLVKP